MNAELDGHPVVVRQVGEFAVLHKEFLNQARFGYGVELCWLLLVHHHLQDVVQPLQRVDIVWRGEHHFILPVSRRMLCMVIEEVVDDVVTSLSLKNLLHELVLTEISDLKTVLLLHLNSSYHEAASIVEVNLLVNLLGVGIEVTCYDHQVSFSKDFLLLYDIVDSVRQYLHLMQPRHDGELAHKVVISMLVIGRLEMSIEQMHNVIVDNYLAIEVSLVGGAVT